MSKNLVTENRMRKELQAILGQGTGKPENSAPKSYKGATQRDNDYTVTFRCAVTGRPFMVIYKRLFPKCFVIKKTVKLYGGTSGESFIPQASRLNINEFRQSGWHCPWCRKAGSGAAFTFIHCGHCDEYVCGGKSYRQANGTEMFRCQDRCGGTGYITHKLKELKATRETKPKEALSFRTTKNSQSPSAPVNGFTGKPDHLRLGSKK